MTTKFQVGKTYFDRSACDYDCIFTMTVTARTEKTITATVRDQSKTLRIAIWNGVEQVKPFGSYSMCAIMRADREVTK